MRSIPCRRACASAPTTYLTCASIMKTCELCPRPVFGPVSTNRFGKPAIVVPRNAVCAAPADQRRARLTPSESKIRCATGKSVTWKPVPKMSVSASWAVPSLVSTDFSLISLMPSVTRQTFGWVRAG